MRDLGVIGYANELPGVTESDMPALIAQARARGRAAGTRSAGDWNSQQSKPSRHSPG